MIVIIGRHCSHRSLNDRPRPDGAVVPHLSHIQALLPLPLPPPQGGQLGKDAPPCLLPPPEVEPAPVDLDLYQHLLRQPPALHSSLSVNLHVS